MAWQRIVVQVLVAGINVAAKAFMRSYQQVVANPQAAQKTVDMASVLSRRMNVAEARLVLNIKEQASKQDIDEAFKRLFEQNEVQKGGSFYLQSKVVREFGYGVAPPTNEDSLCFIDELRIIIILSES